ncbi:hypothetical protein ACP275_02G030700 [Erythranthe tilingii]
MSVFGGDSWGREAQYRKRRVDDLLIENVEASVYKKLPSGKFACLVCPNNPVLDTATTLSTHVNGSRHRSAESKHRKRELAREEEVNRRLAFSDSVSINSASSYSIKPWKTSNKPLIERTRKATSEMCSRWIIGSVMRGNSNSRKPDGSATAMADGSRTKMWTLIPTKKIPTSS